MNRLKFLAFAAVAVGLWAYLLVSVLPAGVGEGANEAAGVLSGAPAAVAVKLESQRSALQAAVIRLAGSNAIWLPAPKSGKPEAPSGDRFNAVRDVVAAALGDSLKGQAVVAVANDVGALVAQGGGDAAAPDESFAATSIAQAAANGGTVVSFKGVNHLFYAVPLASVEKTDVKAAGLVLVGLPVLADANALAASVANDLGVSAVGIVAEGKLVGSGGTSKEALAGALGTLKNGLSPLETGSVGALGPANFPLFVQSPVLSMGVRKAIAGSPFEVIAIASTRAPVERVAALQKLALLGLIGLLVMAIGVAAVLGGGATDDGPRMVVPPPVTLPPSVSKPPQPAAAIALPTEAPAQEAHPDDFHFPAAGAPAVAAPAPAAATASKSASSLPPVSSPAPSPEPMSDPFAAMAPPANPDTTSAGVVPVSVTAAASAAVAAPAPAPAAAAPKNIFEESESTVAYSAGQLAKAISSPNLPAVDPFDAARAQLGGDEAPGGGFDDHNESTRVATIPAELMRAAQKSGPQPAPGVSSSQSGVQKAISMPSIGAVPVASTGSMAAVAAPFDEEKHFQDTYKEFVSTREKCGEPADGLTYEKFKGKLLKNKEQLVAKYQCRTVRFQVYVKEGKAALKASPVKD